jgi:hypothetical protein
LNEDTTLLSWPIIPNIKLMLDRLGEKKCCRFFAIMNLTSSHFQVPIAPETHAFKAFITDSGVSNGREYRRVSKEQSDSLFLQEAMARVIGPNAV